MQKPAYQIMSYGISGNHGAAGSSGAHGHPGHSGSSGESRLRLFYQPGSVLHGY